MRRATSLIALLLCTGGLTATEPKEQKWSVDMGARVLATPAIALDGTVYAGAGKKMFAILAQGNEPSRQKHLLYQFPQPLEASPAVSPDGRYLYVTYNTRRGIYSDAVFEILDLKQPDLVKSVWSYSSPYNFFSAPTIDKIGNAYVTVTVQTLSYIIYNFLETDLLKVSGPKTAPIVTRVYFTNAASRARPKLQLVGPPTYNSGEVAGGAAVIAKAGIISYPYLFYTSFEAVDPTPQSRINYYNYHGWGSFLIDKQVSYSIPAIDNNLKNIASQGTVYTATSLGALEAYQENVVMEKKDIANNYKVPRKWYKNLSNSDLSDNMLVVADNGTVYVGDSAQGILYAVNHEKDQSDTKPGIPLSPYGITARPAIDNKNDIVYVVDTHGGLFAVDARTRTLLWSDKGAYAINDPVVGADGTVVVATDDNKVVAYYGGRTHEAL